MSRSTLIKIASAVGGVVVLAAVIFGVAAISTPSSGQGGLPFIPVGGQPVTTGPAVVPSYGPDASATASATSSSTTVATTSVQTRTDGGSASGDYRVTGTTGTGGSSGATSGATTKKADPIKAVKSQLPTSVTGYGKSGTQADSKTAQIALQPTPAGRIPMALALLTIHDFGTSAKAKAFVTKSAKRLYPSNQQSVAVPGGYVFFGTQGTQFGEVAFYSGRYAYEVTVTSSNGDPLALKDEAVKLTRSYKLP
ncbi:MAG: hypothetical protein WCI74_17395 [Actinomycetes bacterium]